MSRASNDCTTWTNTKNPDPNIKNSSGEIFKTDAMQEGGGFFAAPPYPSFY